jgi:hypothetical protein
MTKPPKPTNKVPFLAALISIFRAAFGVQRKANMERDLNASNPLVFVIAAIVFVAGFIASVLAVVHLVIPN